ncbi:uncharacterized protein PADG_04526 [Paracoccidioides brasiliensis Pb18]|uniref:Uncharacterized protein n=1 Tax=Paracoccidioides brasiliensis (strain Pb18) TaxID=502780 RepID=C1GC04_PARBD|nr:uncharacterized protein PADG_04526 [Paracoccidioides brasiliensis Pb18]EEH48447.2 hypothetical protein PADG_04526 [Paracoccidioides brasiliensis Pb18]
MADAVKFIQLVEEEEEEEEETEQDWPADKVDIMEELESERPMSVEFKNLSCGSATQPLADQYNSAKENQLASLRQMGFIAPFCNPGMIPILLPGLS